MDEKYPFLCQHIRPDYPPLEEGDQTTVTNVNGDEYLDFASQTLNLNLGQLHPEVIDRIKQQLDKIQYTSSKYSDPTSLAFAEELVDHSPSELRRVNHKMTGGSLANECGIKMARRQHDGEVVATPAGSFFGETIATMECGSEYSDSDLLPRKRNAIHVTPQRAGEGASSVHNVIEAWKEIFDERTDICGVLTTPLEVNAGVTADPAIQQKYLRTLRDLCDDNDAALILDEAQTAFGWLCTPFAAQRFDVTPDILTVSKAVAAGFPLGAAICKPEYDNLNYGEHEFTNGANPISCAAGLASISKVTDEEFQKMVRNKAVYLDEKLRELAEEVTGVQEVRSIGLIAGIEMDESKNIDIKEVLRSCMNQGVLFRISGDFRGSTIIAKPPLTVSKPEIDRAIQTLRTALDNH